MQLANAGVLGAALLVSAAAAIFPGCGESQAQGVTSDAHATSCASCHPTQASAWELSRHSASGESPVFNALLPKVAAAWGAAAQAQCVACHTPQYGGDPGIGCVACHSATGNTEQGDGKLIVDLTTPINGPFSDPAATSAHGSRTYDLLQSPDLCGTCHQVNGPHLFIEPTLTEYSSSPASGEGATCQSCHMPAVDPGPIALGASATRTRADHSFVGIDPAWGASPEDAASAAASSVALLTSALGLAATASADGGVDVTLSNFAGHAVPTGAAFLRRIWIDVTFTNAEKTSEIVSSVITLGSQPTSAGVPVPLITDADAVTANVLAPGAMTKAHVAPPLTLTAPTQATVTLHARAIDDAVLTALGLSNRASEVPTHDVSSLEVLLP